MGNVLEGRESGTAYLWKKILGGCAINGDTVRHKQQKRSQSKEDNDKRK